MCTRLIRNHHSLYCTFYLEYFAKSQLGDDAVALVNAKCGRDTDESKEMRYFMLDMQIIYEEFNVTH